MEQAFPNGLAKMAINSMIGLWAVDGVFAYKLTSSDHPGDTPENALKRTTHHAGGVVTDYITKTRLATPCSHRPLHDLCLCTEAVRFGQMIYCLTQQRATMYEFKTDSAMYRPLKRSKPCIEELTFNTLRVRDRFEPSGGALRLNEYHRLPLHGSEQQVFRVQAATERDLMKMVPALPERHATLEIPPRVWKDRMRRSLEC
jgi:hypothetical protein